MPLYLMSHTGVTKHAALPIHATVPNVTHRRHKTRCSTYTRHCTYPVFAQLYRHNIVPTHHRALTPLYLHTTLYVNIPRSPPIYNHRWCHATIVWIPCQTNLLLNWKPLKITRARKMHKRHHAQMDFNFGFTWRLYFASWTMICAIFNAPVKEAIVLSCWK